MRIDELGVEARPRERLLSSGPERLSNAELLAILLQTGTYAENAVDVGNRIIAKYSFDKLPGCSVRELTTIKGIGVAKAAKIVAAFELCRRTTGLATRGTRKIKSAKDVFDFCGSRFIGMDKENFIVIHLDSQHGIIKEERVSIGTLNAALVHARDVFKSAIIDSTFSIVLVHNHPSGNPNPSVEDDAITKQLFAVGEFLGILVLDHVIIGDGKYYSYRN